MTYGMIGLGRLRRGGRSDGQLMALHQQVTVLLLLLRFGSSCRGESTSTQQQQIAELQVQIDHLLEAASSTMMRSAGDESPGEVSLHEMREDDDDNDDTDMLDKLALAGGAITLQPRTYRRRGTWKLAQNGTHVRGVAGMTRLIVEAGQAGGDFSGIWISACPQTDPNGTCAYGQRYSRDKPLHHVYVEGISIMLQQNQSLDANGHCCGLLPDPTNQHGGNGNGQYGLLVTNVAHGHATDIMVSGAHFQGIGIVNSASFHLIRPVSDFTFSTDIAINDFSFDCSITDALVTADGWPADTNWTGQFKDDALAIQGYTKGNRIRGATIRLKQVQRWGGAACVKLSGTSDATVTDVFCEGHSNSLTIDYSQYTDATHSEIIVANLIGVNPVNNGLNLWGSGFPAAAGAPPYSRISIVSPILTQRNTTKRRGIAGAYLCYADAVQITNAQITGFNVGIVLDSGPHPTHYSLSVLGGHIRDVGTAFNIGNQVWTHSRISEVTVSVANATATGPGADDVSWGPISEYDVTTRRPQVPPSPPSPPSPPLKTDEAGGLTVARSSRISPVAAPALSEIVTGLRPAVSTRAFTKLHIRRASVPPDTRWFRLRVNASIAAPKVLWFLASGSTADATIRKASDQTYTFRPLQYGSALKTSRAEAAVVLEAWSGRGGLPDSNETARLLASSRVMIFEFDDHGWSSSLKLVNFSITEFGPGQFTITAHPNNLTAWKLAETITWYGVVPTADGFTEDSLQSAIVHSTRDMENNRPELNRSFSRPGVYLIECFGVWNGEMDWGDGGWQPNTEVGVKTNYRFPMDSSGHFRPVAIVIPWENGTRPAIPAGVGPVHIGSPIPGDLRMALSVERVTVFSGGSLHLPLLDAANGRLLPQDQLAGFAELDIPCGVRLLNNTRELCFPHDCHIEVVHKIGTVAKVDGGAIPTGYNRVQITRPASQWSWLNQAIKIQIQVTDPSLYGRTFALSRVRVYTTNADRSRSDNWQALRMTIAELKPVTRLPRRLRTDFGWSYRNDLANDAKGGLSAVRTWRKLGFNTIPDLGASNYMPDVGFPGFSPKEYDPGELLTPAQRAQDPAWEGLALELHLSPFRSAGFTNSPHGMGSFTALALPPQVADSELDPPRGFNFSAHGLTPAEAVIERTKWRNALVFFNKTKSMFGRGRLDLSYDGWFFRTDVKAALDIVNYTRPTYLRMDIESFEHTLEDWIEVGFLSENFAARKLPAESDGAAAVRVAQLWMSQLITAAQRIVPGLTPDLYDVSAIDGQGYQISSWRFIAALGAPASPCDYYRINLLDRLAASVREERLAILASDYPRSGLRPTISPGETPGVDGLPLYLGSAHTSAYSVLKNQLFQMYAAGATGFAYYTQTGMYDMGLWLAMRDVFELITPHEGIILDGLPLATGSVHNCSSHAVVNGMQGLDGSVLIASSSMPPGKAIAACVRLSAGVTALTDGWRLCDLASNTTVAR
jgi:hypothetical protein